MSVAVTHFDRRPYPGAFSLERLNQDIRAALPADLAVTVWACRNHSKGLIPRLQDMWTARKSQSQVNHVTGDVHYLALLLDPSRTILTIHDIGPLHRLRGLKRYVMLLLWYKLPVQRSCAVLVISEGTKRELLEVAPEAVGKIRVIHNAVSGEFTYQRKDFDISWPRILQVGTKANKNITRVAEAVHNLACTLVIIGELTPDQRSHLAKLSVDVEVHNRLTRDQIAEQYRAADIVVFASLYEGFGMPIIEAQAVGRPVVTSNIDPLREVAGSGACFVDPKSVSSIRAGIVKVINDGDFREHLVAEGLINAKRFDAEVIAGQYAQLYRDVASGALQR